MKDNGIFKFNNCPVCGEIVELNGGKGKFAQYICLGVMCNEIWEFYPMIRWAQGENTLRKEKYEEISHCPECGNHLEFIGKAMTKISLSACNTCNKVWEFYPDESKLKISLLMATVDEAKKYYGKKEKETCAV